DLLLKQCLFICYIRYFYNFNKMLVSFLSYDIINYIVDHLFYMSTIKERRFKLNTRSKVLNLTLGSMFVALTAFGANITSILHFLVIGCVPITQHTFSAVMVS